MIGKIKYITTVVAFSLVLVRCTVYLRPTPEKLESYRPDSVYNFYKYYAAEFEGQIGNNADYMIHFGLNYSDSTYWILISNSETTYPTEDSFSGKYSVNDEGTVFLKGDSPFVNNQYQIVTTQRSIQSYFLAEFKLKGKYSRIFGKEKKSAYCEIGYPYELEECLIGH